MYVYIYMYILPKATVRCLSSKIPPTAKARRDGGIPRIAGKVQVQVFVSRIATLFKYSLDL